jgi:futalosine hydrolase
VVTATAPEAAAVLAAIAAPRERFPVGPYDATAAGPVTSVVAGIGPAAAAAATAAALALGPYDAVLCAGIAGGFGLPIGTAVLASAIVPADLGVTEAAGWRSFGEPVLTTTPRLDGVASGPILTVSTVTTGGLAKLRARHPDAVAEAMEGYGVATAAQAFGIPCHELRTISNDVGDRAGWDVTAALAALTRMAAAVVSMLEP